VQVGDKQFPFAPNQGKVTNLMDAARSITIVGADQESPSWLRSARSADKSTLPADEMISCQNGLIHWPTRTMSAHTPTYYVHHSVPFAFDAKAPAPTRWLSFLAELWPDDQSSIDTLQEMFGYLISGDTRQQKMFLAVGPKRGGKGTIARVLTRVMGKHNVGGSTLASLATNFGLQDLIGKPVCVISDARIGDKSDGSIITERLLSISGEDLLNVDRKYLEPWSGYLPTRIVILTNQLPRFTDASGALASRFVLLRLSQSFYGRENPALTKELCEELPGIFNWSLDGLQRLRERGRFEQPVASADAMREMEDLASPIGAFLRDRCVLGRGKSIEVEALYKIYVQWCLDNGHKARSVQTFGTELRAARPEIKSERPRVGGERVRRYIGVDRASLDWTADRADQGGDEDEVVLTVRGPELRHSANGNDDEGVPHPEFGHDEFSTLRNRR
jgi:putative DNA primase/helicase